MKWKISGCQTPACAAAPRRPRRAVKQFSWNPPWVFILLFAGLLPLLIVAMITTKKMRMHAPFCDEHKGHWSSRTKWSWLGFGLVFLAGVATIMVSASGLDSNNTLFGLACAGTIGLGVVWLIAAAILGNTGIRPTEITDRSITLTNVSPEFVRAMEDHYDENPDRAPYVARGGSSSFPIVALVALGCVVVVVLLAAISVLGEKAPQQNAGLPGPGPGINAPLVNMIPEVDQPNFFRMNYPGPGWSIYRRAEAEKLGAFAGAHHTDGRTGLVRVKDIEGLDSIAGREDAIGKAIYKESTMTKKRLVKQEAFKYQGQAAVRLDYTGDTIELPNVRIRTIVFGYREKLYTMTVLGMAGQTAEDGSSFQPFVSAFQLLDVDGNEKKDRNPPGNSAQGEPASRAA